jgi:hypothetical protein
MAMKMLVKCNEYTVMKCKVRVKSQDNCDDIFGLKVAAKEGSWELIPDSFWFERIAQWHRRCRRHGEVETASEHVLLDGVIPHGKIPGTIERGEWRRVEGQEWPHRNVIHKG